MRQYAQIARRYAQRVLSGAAPACQYVRLSCERALAEWRNPPPGCVWRPSEAARVCQFIERLPEIKGPRAGQNLVLSDWQVFILCQIFGWLRTDGTRRYRRAYIEVPRGNGKSTLSAAIALYMLCADGEDGAEVYAFATTRDQARIVFDTAREMARRSPELLEAFGVTVGRHNIHIAANASKMEPKSSDADVLDGLNTHFACIDELHAHSNRNVYDVVETSLGKRTNNLLWVITTAGSNRAGVCYELHAHVVNVLKGSASDPSQFGLIYTIDSGDDWTTEQALKKANPNWGVSVIPDTVLGLQKKAMLLPSAQGSFRAKHLDEWVGARESWLDMRAWQACGDPSLRIEQFAGRTCWVGIDMAERTDISSVAVVIRGEDPRGLPSYTVFTRHYLPEQTIERGENSHYRGWKLQNRIITSGDACIDQRIIRDSILEIDKICPINSLIYDPVYASQLVAELMERGINCVLMRQSILNFTDPMKELEGLILDGRIRHDADPVLEWMAANVVVKRDEKGNIGPAKETNSAKIDGVVALLMALAGAMNAPSQAAMASVYEERGLAWV